MTLSTRDKVAAFSPVTDRVSRSHCWVRGPNGPRHIDEPLSTDKIALHLTGKAAYGACPIEPGTNTTRIACLDLDNHDGSVPQDKMLDISTDICDTAALLGLTLIPWRSSGGLGLHLYCLWDNPQNAYSTRETLRGILASVGFTEGCGGVAKGEVEIYPRQDSVALGKQGSMFILPGSGKSEPLSAIGWQISDSVPVLPKPERLNPIVNPTTPDCQPDDLSAQVTLDTLTQALRHIPNEDGNDLPYDTWFKIIAGVHAATHGSDEGLQLAHTFSLRSSKYDAEFLDNRVWPYLTDRDDGVGLGTILALAYKHGYSELQFADLGSPAANSTSRFRVIPANEFAVLSDNDYIIKHVIPAGELVVVFGETASGKSFIVLDLAMCIARGVDWRGHKVKQGKVVYIAAEGGNGVRKRVKAYADHHGLDLSAIPFGIINAAPNMMLRPDALEVAKEIGNNTSLIIVDTFAQVMPGGNENAGEDVGKVLAHCKGLHRATGATVLVVHHAGKDTSKGARGWSGLKAAADAELEVIRADDARMIQVTKMKDGADDAKFGFSLKNVVIGTDRDGDTITSAVVEHTNALPAGKKAKATGVDQQLAVDTWIELSGLSGDPVDRIVLEDAMSKSSGKRKSTMNRAVKSLIDSGVFESVLGMISMPSRGIE